MAALRLEMERLGRIMDGDARYRYKGVLERVETLETLIEAIQDEREAIRNQIRGMQLLAGLASSAGGAAALAWVAKLLGVIKI